MKSRDDLNSVLHLGWETARRAWRLLAPGHRESVRDLLISSIPSGPPAAETSNATEFANALPPSSPSTCRQELKKTGRDLDQLAYDLRRLGQEKPARLAYSVAFVINGLAADTIQFNDNLADKTSQIVAILAEMLLELESTSELTTAEPTELVEHLKAQWGLVIYAESHTANRLPKPHFHAAHDSTMSPAENILQGVRAISDEMLRATELLIDRIQQMPDFPFAPALSRVHHLATSLRQQVGGERDASAPKAGDSHPTDISVEVASTEAVTLVDHTDPRDAVDEPICRIEPADQATRRRLYYDLTPSVLVIDGSPFFRMLLTSAIEACRYSLHAVASLEEAVTACGEIPWSLVVWGGPENQQDTERLRNWLNSTASPEAMIISLTVDGTGTCDSIQNCFPVRRTDLLGMLSLITKTLGIGASEERKIA